MSFSPQFRALFAGALAEQAIALLQRDITGALAGITPPPTRVYSPFVAYKKALDNVPVNPPEVIVAMRTSNFDREDNGRFRGEAHRLMVRPFLVDQDPDFAAQAAYDYLRAIDQVFTSASLRDWAQPLPIAHKTRAEGAETAGVASIGGSVLDVWVETHDYGVLWAGPKGFGVMPTLTAMIEVVEV